MEILEIFFESLAHTFLHVGALVAIVLLLFNLINYLLRGKLVLFIESKPRLQPLFGALLGLTPGCGGVIILLPLYMRKSVSYGTIIAAFIATMGDSAFLLIATRPKEYLLIAIISLVAAIITGYFVDYIKLDHKLKIKHKESENFTTISHLECEVDISHHEHQQHKQGKLKEFYDKYFYFLFWTVVIIGFVFGFKFFLEGGAEDIHHEHNDYAWIGIIGTLLSIFILIVRYISKHKHHHCSCELANIKSIITQTGEDAAFVITWIFIASLAYESLAHIIGPNVLETNLLAIYGLTTVFIGALVGLIPGCGPQIIFASLYLQGFMPFAALLANAISQDGDALFPFLALNKKAAFYSILIKLIPGLLVGIAYFYIQSLI